MTDTVIVGAGLCGLAVAEHLEARGQGYLVVEGRDCAGGRILSEPVADSAVDMGPAWFWPGQPRMAALMDRLGQRRFDQFAVGEQMFEDNGGEIMRGRGMASMEGSWRVDGGLQTLTDALAARLPARRLRLKANVVGVSREDEGVTIALEGRATIHARRVIFAMPPRLVSKISFEPMLTGAVLSAMEAVPTWMAGQAKAIATYPSPFWRDAGLSGDAVSRIGPMVEIHDASPADAGFGALFGFIGAAPSARTDEGALRASVLAQFSRLFGGCAPSSLHIKDWARDPYTAVAADAAPLMSHPACGLPSSVQRMWQGRLILSGTETAQAFGGFLEGALEAAEDAVRAVLN